MLKYPNLFSPLQVGNVLFRNRIFASATGHLDIKADKTLSTDALLYYERKAIGGAAQVYVGECHVDTVRGTRGGVKLHFKTKALAITEQGVNCAGPDGERVINAETVIYATGQEPLTAEAAALGQCAPAFHMVGDCLGPKNIMHATRTASTLAKHIGRS